MGPLFALSPSQDAPKTEVHGLEDDDYGPSGCCTNQEQTKKLKVSHKPDLFPRDRHGHATAASRGGRGDRGNGAESADLASQDRRFT